MSPVKPFTIADEWPPVWHRSNGLFRHLPGPWSVDIRNPIFGPLRDTSLIWDRER